MSDRINGNKVKLRRANHKDAELLCKWYSDGRVMVHVGFANGLKQDVQNLRNQLIDYDSTIKLLIILDENDIPIGECNYNDLDEAKCSIGIKICELQYQGKGYGEDAICTLINYLFHTYNLKQIDLDTLIENTRAQRLYKKVGFKVIKIDENCWVDPTGRSRSTVEMTLLREDFLESEIS